MPKYVVTKAMKVLLETTNNNSESQLVWLCVWLCCQITRQIFHNFATGFYYAACRWEHGTTASSAGLLVNTANEFPALIPFIQVPVLTENMLSRAKRATSRSYIIKAYHLFQKTDPFEIFTEEINTQVFR